MTAARAIAINVIGEFDPGRPTQVGTNRAIELAAQAAGVPATIEWIDTHALHADAASALSNADGIWSAPGNPPKNHEGALAGIRYARENGRPFIGTCMGFQEAAIEYARNVLGIADAAHAEIEPDATNKFIDYLSCSVRGQTLPIHVKTDSRAYYCYRSANAIEQYYCSMSLSRENQRRLNKGGFRIAGVDADGDARILELPDHPFYMTTLFVPQLNLGADNTHPIIQSFMAAAIEQSAAR